MNEEGHVCFTLHILAVPVSSTSYVYDGMYSVCEFDGSERLKASYVYANGLLLGKIHFTPGGRVAYYYHHDALGSTMGLTDETGNVPQAYLYDEFGNLLQSWGNVPNHYLYTGQEWDSEITGTELYNLRARYYEPWIGRFIQEDPILQADRAAGESKCAECRTASPTPLLSRPLLSPAFPLTDTPQVLNAYLYVCDNPVNWTDPLGLSRYKMCEGLPWFKRWFCRKIVDFGCRREPEVCCKSDLTNCQEDLDPCDPEFELKFHECYLKYLECMAKIQP